MITNTFNINEITYKLIFGFKNVIEENIKIKNTFYPFHIYK